MPDELEEKILEAIKKKKELEKKLEEVKERRIEALEKEIKSRFGDIVRDVIAYIEGREVVVVVYPNEKYKDCLETLEPLTYSTPLRREEFEGLIKGRPGIARKIAEIVSDRLMMNYFKPQLLSSFGVEATARKIGRTRALEIFAYMCQRGSVFHCTALYNALSHLIKEAVGEEDRSIVGYFTEYIRRAGFPITAKFIEKLDPFEFSFEELDEIKETLSQAVKEVIQRCCARIVYNIDAVTPSEIEKTKRIVFESCKLSDFELKPEPFDETPILEALKRLASRIPKLGKYLEALKIKVEERRKVVEERKRLEEELRKLKEEREKLLKELEKLRKEKEKLEKGKEEFKKKLKKRIRRRG